MGGGEDFYNTAFAPTPQPPAGTFNGAFFW